MTNEIRVRVGRHIKVIDLPTVIEAAHIGDAAIYVSRVLGELSKQDAADKKRTLPNTQGKA